MTANRSSDKTFARSIAEGVTLVDFDASWCSPCRDQAPIIKALAKTFCGKARIKTIDIESHRHIALKLGIQSIPTIILYKDGREMHRFIGLQTRDTLKRALALLVDGTF